MPSTGPGWMPGHRKLSALRRRLDERSTGDPGSAADGEQQAHDAAIERLRAARSAARVALAHEGLSVVEIAQLERDAQRFLVTLAEHVGALDGRLELHVIVDGHGSVPVFVGPGPDGPRR